MITTEDVDRVALMMCVELGLDPEAIITIGYYDDYTEAELPLSLRGPRYTPPARIHNPGVAPPYFVHGYKSAPYWRTLRPKAALALAGWKAVHKYVLTET